MDGKLTLPSTEELARRGAQKYEELKQTLEPAHDGHYVAIEVESGKYFLGDTAEKAIEAAKYAFPDKLFFITRIGGAARISVRFLHKV